MMKARSNLKKRLKKKFIVFIMLFIALFSLYFAIKNTDNIANQIRVKEINIGADNDK